MVGEVLLRHAGLVQARRLDGSIKDFLSAAETLKIDSGKLEDAVIGVLAKDLRPMSPAVRSLVDIRRMIYRISDSDRERKQQEVLSLTVDDVVEAGRTFASELRKGEYCIAVIGDRKALENSGYSWEQESLPQ